MNYHPDLTTIAELSDTSLSLAKSFGSSSGGSNLANVRRSILSGLNSRTNQFDDDSVVEQLSEHSEIIEEDDQPFRDQKRTAQKSFDDTPVGIARNSTEKENARSAAPARPSSAGDSSNAKPKRPFLKRGEGRLGCTAGARALELQKRQERAAKTGISKPASKAIKPTKTQTQKNSAKSKITTRKVQTKTSTVKQNENVKRQGAKTVPAPIQLVKPSQQKFSRTSAPVIKKIPSNTANTLTVSAGAVPSVSHYQSSHHLVPDSHASSYNDSIDISIANERQQDIILRELEQKEDEEFALMEKIISSNPELTVNSVERELANIKIEDFEIEDEYDDLPEDETTIEAANSFDPGKYGEDESDSFIAASRFKTPDSDFIPNEKPKMTRKSATFIPDMIDSEEENSPFGLNRGFNANQGRNTVNFSDSEPWDSQNEESYAPSFSTPTKEVAKPTNLMSKMFNSQFRKVQDEQEKAEKKEQNAFNELEKMKAELEKEKQDVHVMKLRLARETKGMEQLRQERVRERDIFNLNIARMKNEYVAKLKEVEVREREMTLREKEGKKLTILQKDSEKAGQARRKELDEMRFQFDEKVRELNEKNARLLAQNSRYKTENERLDKLYQATKNENVKLNEQIDNLIRNTKRKEGNTWKEINRIVEHATKPAANNSNSRRAKSPDNHLRKSMRKHDSLNISSASSGNSNSANQSANLFTEIPCTVPSGAVINSTTDNGAIVQRLASGKTVTKYANGTIKEVSADGKSIVQKYQNGDIEHVFPDGKTVYFYAENGATQTKNPDSSSCIEFSTGQKEISHADGSREIIFPDGVREIVSINGRKETVHTDGVRKILEVNGDEIVMFPDGQKETRTKEFRRRVLPDGTTKTIFLHNKYTETRYATGRVRIKDDKGNIIVDRMAS